MTAVTHHSVRFNLADVALWTGVFAAPVAWTFNLATVYALADIACEADNKFKLHFASVFSLAIALCGVAVAWRNVRTVAAPPVEPAHSEPQRVNFMAHLGLMTSCLFALAIVAQWIAVAMLQPCPG